MTYRTYPCHNDVLLREDTSVYLSEVEIDDDGDGGLHWYRVDKILTTRVGEGLHRTRLRLIQKRTVQSARF